MISINTYSKWIKRYNKEGKEGLKRYKSSRKEERVIWEGIELMLYCVIFGIILLS
jgi:transposase